MLAWNSKFFPKETLEQLYVKEKLSIAQIAKKLGTASAPIYKLIKVYKISTRSLSLACQKILVSKKQLRQWYFKDKLSMDEIAERLGCTHSAIVYKFQKLGLKSRGHLGLRKPLRITKEGLEVQYKRGISLAKIARMFRCSESGLEKKFKQYGVVSRGINNRACKYKKYNFSNDLAEKAYLIGFRLGDLNVYNLKNVIQIRCSTTHIAQVKLIKKMFASYTTPYICKAKRGTYEIICLVNKSFIFLIPKEDKIPDWILNKQETFFSFLAGYSDAEGSFYINRSFKCGKYGTANFEIQTQQKQILSSLHEGLKNYGIYTQTPSISRRGGSVDRRGIKNNKDIWRLSVHQKESIWKLIYFLNPYLEHAEKVKKVKEIKENIILRNNSKRCQPINLSVPM